LALRHALQRRVLRALRCDHGSRDHSDGFLSVSGRMNTAQPALS